ncbi:MAG: STAS domain-containing protein [Clostridia bacterium]|jgi:anti-sigma B factor antagonist|nr:STAS domain-containing protein [Clostridia bacterium]
MNIDLIKNDGAIYVTLDGRLDTTNAPKFEELLSENYADAQSLIINCEKLAYVSSAGLRVLLAAQKKMRDSMKLTNVCELVMEVFEMTGFADILTIE